jgi:hypothetical protein
MNKRGLVNWAIWIGGISGIYCALYALTIGRWTGGVMSGWHIMCATFTALPIFFTAGAKREDWLKYCCSNVMGVLWGMLYLFCMDRLNAAGWPWWANAMVVIAVLCIIECAIHFNLPAGLQINVVPAHFGAISSTFWTCNLTVAVTGTAGSSAIGGFYNFSAIPFLMLTLVGGVTLGLICNEGLNFINGETGRWQLPGKKKIAAY